MSEIQPADFKNLKTQAESLHGWFNTTDAWLDTSEDSACAVVGHISDEGALYPVAVVDCDQYDAPSDSMKLAKFYASANPKAILELIVAYEALQKEKDKIEDELDQYKEHHEELTEHYKALQFLESEFRKENADLQLRLDAKTLSHQMMLDRTLELQAENDDQKRKIISLENELVEWNEFKKIRDAQMQALRKQMP